MGTEELENVVQIGETVAGKYRIDRVIGKGGMGLVVAAHHIQLDERVAIKFLLPSAVGKPELLARFEREGRAAVKIKNEHVARVSDVGVLPNGAPYMVMEFLEGVDLSQRITQVGRMAIPQTVDFVLQACEAVVEAHSLGIVHRDLKPANLFITRRADGLESIKVLDFGISKADGLGSGASGNMTQTQSVLGSPFYMSPEQMQSARSVDMRSDIWALGCILYQSVTGELPFMAESLPELVLKIVTANPPPLRQYRPDAPPAFEQIVLRCLQKQREHRFQNIGELAVQLVPFGSEHGRSSAELIMRVVQNSGLGSGAHSVPSSASMPVASYAPQNVPYAQHPLAESTPTGPHMRPHNESRLSHNPGGAPSGVPSHSGPVPSNPVATSTLGLGPPLGTVPPQGASTGHGSNPSQPGFGATSGSGTWGQGEAGPKPANGATSAVAIAVALAVVVFVLGGVGFGVHRYLASSTPAGQPDASAGIVTPPASVSAAVVLPSATVSAEPVVQSEDAGNPDATEATAPVDAGNPVVISSPVPFPAPLPAPHPVNQPSPQPPPGPTAKPGCNPPYYYDANNNRVFKKECL